MTALQLPSAGDHFVGKWNIDAQVGKGGFSVVYRAFDAQNRVGAIKILLPEDKEAGNTKLSYDGELADRFLREARLLERLENPYIMRLWDYGKSPDGLLYMVFEFIDGRSLFDEIKEKGPMSGERVTHVLRQTLVGLETAHQMGILHRDIKPNNIMLFERDGDPDRVKLVDFGIAKMYGESSAMPGNDLTAAGLLVGTPRYMPPEQLRGEDLAPCSDIYSLGLCAIEMLTGRKCIPTRDRLKIIERQLVPEPIPVPMDADASQGLRQILNKMLRKKREERYQSATDALRDLEKLAGDPGATGDTVYEKVPSSLEIPSTAPAGDEETVLHRVSTSDLNSIIAQQGGKPIEPEDSTVPAGVTETTPMAAGGPHQQSMSSGEFPRPPDQSFGSGEFPRPDQSFGSGEFPRPDQSFGSGEFPHPNRQGLPNQQGFGSGEFPRPNQQGLGSGEFPRPNSPGVGSGEFARPAPNAGTSGEFQHPTRGGMAGAPPGTNGAGLQNLGGQLQQGPASTDLSEQSKQLTSDEKKALAACIIPGLGHLLFLNQTVKGVGALAIFLLTLGFAWVILAPVTFADAFLVIRAKKRREVEPLEFFPDYQELL